MNIAVLEFRRGKAVKIRACMHESFRASQGNTNSRCSRRNRSSKVHVPAAGGPVNCMDVLCDVCADLFALPANADNSGVCPKSNFLKGISEFDPTTA